MLKGAIFSAWNNSLTHLCFICASMTGAILSDCPPLPSGARQQSLWDIGGKVQPLLPYHLHPLDVVDQHNKIGGISFVAPLVHYNFRHSLLFIIWLSNTTTGNYTC